MSLETRVQECLRNKLGGWSLEKKIGNGSNGTVVFRITKRNNTFVEIGALKVVQIMYENNRKDELSQSDLEDYQKLRDEKCKRAEAEIALLYSLRGCTGIVDFLDHATIDWEDEFGFGCDLLIRMELMKGDVRKFLRKEDFEFSEKQTIELGLSITEALVECHKNEILHRDIKPENIFITAKDKFILGDFGIARKVNQDGTATTAIGTKEYAAPEQFRRQVYDTVVDIYSLGLVLYEMMNDKRLPFAETKRLTDAEFMLRMQGQYFGPPCNASDGLARVIMKACSYDVDKRYRSAQEFHEDLERVKYGQEPLAPLLPHVSGDDIIITPIGDDTGSGTGTSGGFGIGTSGGSGEIRDLDGTIAVGDNRGNDSGSNGSKKKRSNPVPPAYIIKSPYKQIAPGVHIYMGEYPQADGRGKQLIEWRVLDVQAGKALVVSEFGLDCMPYNIHWRYTNWCECSLRKWLNTTFMDNAFPKECKDSILKTAVKNPGNSWNKIPGIQDTYDYVFLLSSEEVMRYFRKKEELITRATQYAKSRGAVVKGKKSDGYGYWWLRTVGGREDGAMMILPSGEIYTIGYFVDCTKNMVRPAMWIQI